MAAHANLRAGPDVAPQPTGANSKATSRKYFATVLKCYCRPIFGVANSLPMFQSMRNSIRVISSAGWMLIASVAVLICIVEFGLQLFAH
jgi:hypothetical protein